MSRRLLAAACLLLMSAPQLAAQGDGPHHGPHGGKQEKQEIVALEDQWKAATLAADVPAMEKLLSDDYVGISWTGQVNTKTMQLDRTRNHSLNITQFDVSDQKIKVVGPIAIVTARVDVDGSNNGSDIKGEFLYTRIYQRLPTGVWQITNFQANRIPPEGRQHHPPKPPQPSPPAGPPNK